MEETLASQARMLVHRQEEGGGSSEAELRRSYEKHLSQIKLWLQAQPNMQVLYVSYNAMLEQPIDQVERIVAFLKMPLDQAQMCHIVDPNLYRQRG